MDSNQSPSLSPDRTGEASSMSRKQKPKGSIDGEEPPLRSLKTKIKKKNRDGLPPKGSEIDDDPSDHSEVERESPKKRVSHHFVCYNCACSVVAT